LFYEFCVVLRIVCFVSFSIVWVYMCTELLPPGGYPMQLNISYHIETTNKMRLCRTIYYSIVP